MTSALLLFVASVMFVPVRFAAMQEYIFGSGGQSATTANSKILIIDKL
jgi:hypothetical protein